MRRRGLRAPCEQTLFARIARKSALYAVGAKRVMYLRANFLRVQGREGGSAYFCKPNDGQRLMTYAGAKGRPGQVEVCSVNRSAPVRYAEAAKSACEQKYAARIARRSVLYAVGAVQVTEVNLCASNETWVLGGGQGQGGIITPLRGCDITPLAACPASRF
jgi:hypothetical protein